MCHMIYWPKKRPRKILVFLELKWVEASPVGHRKSTPNQLSQSSSGLIREVSLMLSWLTEAGQETADYTMQLPAGPRRNCLMITSTVRLSVRPSVRLSVWVRHVHVVQLSLWVSEETQKFPNFCAISTCPTLCQSFPPPPSFFPAVRPSVPVSVRPPFEIHFMLIFFSLILRLHFGLSLGV